LVRVTVIGAEIAGLSAAKFAAEYGANVTVYDGKKEIGKPLMGGEIFACVPGYELKKPRGAIYSPKRAVFHGKGEYVLDLPEDALWVTDRKEMVRALAGKAEGEDAEIVLGKRITVKEAKAEADFVIDASGFPSQCFRELGKPKIKEKAFAIFYNAEGDFSKFGKDLHFWWRKDKVGYAWVFPKSKKMANVGIGWKHDGTIPNFQDLDSFLSFLEIDTEIIEKGGGLLPMSLADELMLGNVLLVGDAAGLMNSSLGAGNHLAYLSGRTAGILAAQNRAYEYPWVIKKIVGREISSGRMVFWIQKRGYKITDFFFRLLPKLKEGDRAFYNFWAIAPEVLKWAVGLGFLKH